MSTGSNKTDILDNRKNGKTDKELNALIRKTVNAALKYEKVTVPCEVSVCLTDNNEIQRLNNEFRNTDKPTDVLSFPSGEYPSPVIPCFLGDIVISLERAESQAAEYGNGYAEEVAFLTAHSVLHLLGYDHMNAEEEKVMFEKQDNIMTLLGINRKTD